MVAHVVLRTTYIIMYCVTRAVLLIIMYIAYKKHIEVILCDTVIMPYTFTFYMLRLYDLDYMYVSISYSGKVTRICFN